MTSQELHDAVAPILKRIKATTFVDGDKASDTAAMGMLLSRYFGWEPSDIFAAAGYALEDANYHTDAAELLAKAGVRTS